MKPGMRFEGENVDGFTVTVRGFKGPVSYPLLLNERAELTVTVEVVEVIYREDRRTGMVYRDHVVRIAEVMEDLMTDEQYDPGIPVDPAPSGLVPDEDGNMVPAEPSEGTAGDVDDRTLTDLKARASELEIAGRSSMDRDELVAAIEKAELDQ